jgi:hypothetical protein
LTCTVTFQGQRFSLSPIFETRHFQVCPVICHTSCLHVPPSKSDFYQTGRQIITENVVTKDTLCRALEEPCHTKNFSHFNRICIRTTNRSDARLLGSPNRNADGLRHSVDPKALFAVGLSQRNPPQAHSQTLGFHEAPTQPTDLVVAPQQLQFLCHSITYNISRIEVLGQPNTRYRDTARPRFRHIHLSL